MSGALLRRLLVPIATKADAEKTIPTLMDYVDGETSELHVVHVIEKAGGAPDKAPLEARQEQAEKIFSFVERFVGDRIDVTTELRYGTDIVDEIIASAEESDVTAIAFVPRPSGRIPKILTGDTTRRLVANEQIPVLVLPGGDNH
ncbi:universal stress protein [Natrialbaceae archaeon A-chndr2]